MAVACLESCFAGTTLQMAWHLTCLPAMQASSWPHHSIQLIPAQPGKACWHCSQASAFCWKGNLSAALTPPHCSAPPQHTTLLRLSRSRCCTCNTRLHSHRGACSKTISRLQHTTAFNPSSSKSESSNTTALKVPGRSLSRVLVEPNPV